MSKIRSIPQPYQFVRPLHDELPVFEAKNIHTGIPCVVKFGSCKSFLVTEDSQAFRRRLAAESEQLKRWSNCPNVVRLLDVQLGRTSPFIVLEYLGDAVEQELPDDGLSLPDALTVMCDVCEAVAAIHALGDFHGDIKPDNILKHPATDLWTLIDPGAEGFQTAEFSNDRLNGFENDILALGRTFITLLTGKIDTDLDEFARHWLENEAGGDRLLRVLDCMLQVPNLRRTRPLIRPNAAKVLAAFRAAAGVNGWSYELVSEPALSEGSTR